MNDIQHNTEKPAGSTVKILKLSCAGQNMTAEGVRISQADTEAC